MKVLTTDNTAGPASDGGNFIDVTAADRDWETNCYLISSKYIIRTS